jgi:hypothetical protein
MSIVKAIGLFTIIIVLCVIMFGAIIAVYAVWAEAKEMVKDDD